MKYFKVYTKKSEYDADVKTEPMLILIDNGTEDVFDDELYRIP